jgi:hypothetical protein
MRLSAVRWGLEMFDPFNGLPDHEKEKRKEPLLDVPAKATI